MLNNGSVVASRTALGSCFLFRTTRYGASWIKDPRIREQLSAISNLGGSVQPLRGFLAGDIGCAAFRETIVARSGYSPTPGLLEE